MHVAGEQKFVNNRIVGFKSLSCKPHHIACGRILEHPPSLSALHFIVKHVKNIALELDGELPVPA